MIVCLLVSTFILSVQGSQGTCHLPPYPKNGHYTLEDYNSARPGEKLPSFVMHVSCDPGYHPSEEAISCLGGWRSHDSVPECLPCGVKERVSDRILGGGRDAEKLEIPWHAGVYYKTSEPYRQICGGTLVSTNVVISAAHCFWNEAERVPQPAKNFAIGVGKIYRQFNDPHDELAQKSDVLSIHIPSSYQGSSGNFQNDLAVLVLTSPFRYTSAVRPICLDFDEGNDEKQLNNGALGQVAGWGLTSTNGPPSSVLQTVEMPYVKIEECISTAPKGFVEYITSDKICAGFNNGTALCRGDGGAGLYFSQQKEGLVRYILRGVLSTATSTYNSCNLYPWATFTHVVKHERFISKVLKLTADTATTDSTDS